MRNRVHGHLFRQPKSEGYRCTGCGEVKKGKPFARVERVVKHSHPNIVPLCPACWDEYQRESS
jgi:hypothetical protein